MPAYSLLPALLALSVRQRINRFSSDATYPISKPRGGGRRYSGRRYRGEVPPVKSPPAGPVEALSYLIEQWLNQIGPGYGDCNLDAIWDDLATGLCGGNPKLRAAFRGARVYLRGETTTLPLSTLEHRLRDLNAAGFSKMFAVITVRQAMDRLIASHCPDHLDAWTQLADDILPLRLQFGLTQDEMPSSSSVTYGPGTQL